MRFEPVFLPPNRALEQRASQTFLRHYDRCPRSGYLYALYKGEASTVDMVRGRAGHEVYERATKACLETGEVTIPPELVKAIVDEVLAEQHVPFDQHDYLRESAYRWASETAIDPSSVIACETLIVLDVDGWQVRMKVDRAELLEGGAACKVIDYKTGQGMPTKEEVARKRSTPLAGGGVAAALMAKSFQLVLYALGLRYGRPVRVEECPGCPRCHAGLVTTGEFCNGRGEVEVVEPFPLAERVQRFDCSYVFPGIEDKQTGEMATRDVSLSLPELDAYLQSLRGLLKRVGDSETSGDWPAQTSDDGCGECPAKLLCPIPAELRDHAGRINTREEAEEAAEKLNREKALHRARQAELKKWAEHNGGVLRIGTDKVQEFVPTASEEIKDKEGLWAAVERAVRYGEPFERSEHVVEKTGTSFKVRKLTADELAAEAAEGVSDGNGNAGLDERFGADAPL
jgi:hypothetical protein